MTRRNLCPAGTRLLIAVSGGSDSVALLRLMTELAGAGAHVVAAIAHFNHQLRPAAARDQMFCRELAARLGCPIVVGTADVRARAEEEGLSIEAAARCERYAFLHAAAEGAGADRIATGHTRDDQVETFLLKLARGAGLTGLGGIYPSRDRLVRPLLDVTHSELQAYLRALGERWVDDETNADITNPRNRVRHVLLPQFENAFGVSIRETIARAAALAGEDGEWLDAVATERLGSLLAQVGEAAVPGRVALDAAELRALPRPILHRVLLQVMRGQAADREVGLTHVDAAVDVLAARAASADGPGGRWELIGGKLVLLKRGQVDAGNVPAAFSYPLDVPGEVLVPEAECLIVAERLGARSGSSGAELWEASAVSGRSDMALVWRADVDRFVVRSRRPGDRLRLPGLTGRKKLQDIFVDAKVPLRSRDTTPLVVHPDDRIVWVPGHAISADFRVNGGEDAVIRLTLTRLGGKS